MKIDAEIICRRTEYGDVCEWKGGKVATIDGVTLRYLRRGQNFGYGDVFEYGRLKMRTVGTVAGNAGWGTDHFYAMLESPHAQLYWLYREKAEHLLRFVLRCEAAVNAFLLKPIDGVMPFTAKVADKLL